MIVGNDLFRFYCFAQNLLKIENIDPLWLSDVRVLDKRIDMQTQDDVIF